MAAVLALPSPVSASDAPTGRAAMERTRRMLSRVVAHLGIDRRALCRRFGLHEDLGARAFDKPALERGRFYPSGARLWAAVERVRLHLGLEHEQEQAHE